MLFVGLLPMLNDLNMNCSVSVSPMIQKYKLSKKVLHNTYIFFTYMCILYPKVKGQLFIGVIRFYKNTSYAILKHHNLEIRVEAVF